MKKVLMSAAVVTMMLASCTNEELVNQGTDGRMFTLEVTKGANSRTALDGLQTVWSEGDKIYVTSEDGKTTGVLTLASKPGLPDGTFQGYIFGEGELKYSVYPVPTQEGLNLGAADVNKLDAPMTGEINAGTASFVNSCGLVKLNILGLGKGDVVKVSGAEIGSVIEYDLATNSWVKKSAGSTISITGAQDATEFFVPVYTTNTTATDVELSVSVNGGKAQKVTVPVAVKKVNPETPILAVTSSTGAVVDTSDPEASDELGDDFVYVSTLDELKKAIKMPHNNVVSFPYVVIKGGTYNISSNEEMILNKDITIVGDGMVTFVPTTQKNDWRVINIHGGNDDNRNVTVKLKNITIENNQWTKWNIYLRAYPGTEKTWYCNLKVEMDNVTCRDIIMDNAFAVEGIMNLDFKTCDVQKVQVEACPWSSYNYNSYCNLKYENESNLGIFIPEGVKNGGGINNIKINGETPKKSGWFVEYKNNEIEE